MMTTTRRPVERSGLRKRPQMEQIVHYLAMHQEKVKFPDRTALFIRNHPYMTQLDFSICKRHKRYNGRNSSSNIMR